MPEIGQPLSHYRIIEEVGGGGMGVVYKAQDLHLDRFVALKILPPEKVADAERKRRFVQEAKAASAINHPNIVTIHDITEESGTDFIVMEYVEGQTLDQRIGHRGMRLNDALKSAIQIADALVKAHAAGIIHRDLKPTNIMVNENGVVKVLDFGLAKLTERVAGDEFASTSTVDAGRPITEEGVIVGTVAYMSPEQAEGRKVDARSDIFSLGSVLYEMVTGQKAFQGKSRMSTLSAILRDEPKPVSGIAPAIPADLEKLINRCLRKDPAKRFQHMDDVKVALEELKEESDSGKFQPAAAARRLPRGTLWGAVALALLLAGGGSILWMRGRAPVGTGSLELTPLTFDAAYSGSASVSRDGRYIAYISDRGGSFDVWVRRVERPQPQQRTHDPDGAHVMPPAVSPDGSRIVYRSNRDGGSLYIMDTLGGEGRKLAANGICPRFSPDGQSILYMRQVAGDRVENKDFLISPEGGEPREVHPGIVSDPVLGASGPLWSPDSKRILFSGTRKSDGRHGWWIASIDGGQTIQLDISALPQQPGPTFPSAWPWEDTVIYAHGTQITGVNLYRILLEPGTGRLIGPPQPLTSGPGLIYDASVSEDGRLAFSMITTDMNLWSLPLDTSTGKAAGEPQQLTFDTQTKRNLGVAWNASKAAWSNESSARGTPRQFEVRLLDISTGHETLLPSGPAMGKVPRLSADGSLIAYRERVADGLAAFISTPSGEAQRFCTGCRILAFFPDPDEMLVLRGSQVVRQRRSGGSQTPVLAPKAGTVVDAQLSSDGRWVAFVFDWPGGRSGIYVAPAGGAAVPESQWIAVEESDTARSEEPAWSADGRFLYFLSERDGSTCLWARRLDSVSHRPLGEAFTVLHGHSGRRSFWGRGMFGIGVARDRLYALIAEMKGNVWTARLPR